ncbi:hypothetical protein KC669_01150, partial [Candidatus Dojkabacteria bacterium]|nr:hypothetical protein [Candidatus Dojkabacteria bacterium]
MEGNEFENMKTPDDRTHLLEESMQGLGDDTINLRNDEMMRMANAVLDFRKSGYTNFDEFISTKVAWT